MGGYTDNGRFTAFLANWEALIARRVDDASAACGQVNGLHGLILAGGVGRGAPWLTASSG